MKIKKPIIYKEESEVPDSAIKVNAYDSALKELFFIENPHLKSGTPPAEAPLKEFLENDNTKGIWVFYPWRNTAVHTLPEELYFKLRTSRNRNIINSDEQEKYRNLSVGVAGLSVGSAVVSAFAVSGGPKNIKIADFDVLEVTNLNRIRATLLDVDSNKAEIAAKSVWELDPFADIELFGDGVNGDNIRDFLLKPKVDIFVDEMDMINMKILSRLIAKENGIPVIMATDNGDGVIVDVERFDLEPEREIFHGLVGHMTEEDTKDIDFKKWLQLATQIVDPDYLTPHMQESLLEIGKTIPAVPQIGTSASVAGSAISYVVRRIANGHDMPSGRYVVSIEEKLIPEYMSKAKVVDRKKKTEDFKSNFGKK